MVVHASSISASKPYGVACTASYPARRHPGPAAPRVGSAVADMIGNYMKAPMAGHEDEAREEHTRGMSGSGVSVRS